MKISRNLPDASDAARVIVTTAALDGPRAIADWAE
jgi:hypothetical protein